MSCHFIGTMTEHKQNTAGVSAGKLAAGAAPTKKRLPAPPVPTQ
jgi:hypothetical protein